MSTLPEMNSHEKAAWSTLLWLGARHMVIGEKHALDLSPIRVTSKHKNAKFIDAVINVVGRSGRNRRHVDGFGRPVYVVTDDDLGPLPLTPRAVAWAEEER